MTVNTTNITSGPYVGNDASDEYSYTFRVTDKTQLKVFETDTDGVRTELVVDTDYTVAGIGVDAGGTITRVAGDLPTDYEWYIRSDYDETQLSALPSQGPFFPDIHEDAFDKLTFLIQQVNDFISRSIRLSDEIDIDGVFTVEQDATTRAGLYLGFDDTGNTAVKQLSDASLIDQEDLDKRHNVTFLTVASMKATSPVDIAGNPVILNAGISVRTQSYYTPLVIAGNPFAGGSSYIIRTAADYSDTPDEYGDITLANGNIAVLQGDDKNVLQFGAKGDGVTDDRDAFAAALLSLSGGGTLHVPYVNSGQYNFDILGDSDTLLIQSNSSIVCDAGVQFLWDYWGSPLFAIVNKTNVNIELNGAEFIWSGTFGTTTGSLDKFSYGKALPAYEWCAHIISVGSEYVSISGGKCSGDTTSNVQNVFIGFRGKNDDSLTKGNSVTGVVGNDVCQVITWGEQEQFSITDIKSLRYSNASNVLYGPGHVVYVVAGATRSKNGIISGIKDDATALSSYTSGSHTLSIKFAESITVSDVMSNRPEGVLAISDVRDSDIDIAWNDTASDDDTNSGGVYFSNPTNPNNNLNIKAVLVASSQRDMSPFSCGGVADSASNINCDIDLDITRTINGTESAPTVNWIGDYGSCDLVSRTLGSGGARVLVSVDKGSSDNNFRVESLGTVANPRVHVGATGSPSNNTFWCRGDSTIDYDSNEFAPASGNAVIWESSRAYQSLITIGSTTNPATTFQLPKPGGYLVNINLKTSDANHARSGLYWVVFDDASANDFITAQLIGTQISKGGVPPSVLTLAVDNAGLCTVTSTAGSNTWILSYGYRQLTVD